MKGPTDTKDKPNKYTHTCLHSQFVELCNWHLLLKLLLCSLDWINQNFRQEVPQTLQEFVKTGLNLKVDP